MPFDRSDLLPAHPKKKTTSASTGMDLSVVDAAYGEDADLYVDVLRVSCLASPEEIQVAFFDRRSELFGILSKLAQSSEEEDEISLSQRRFAERRMDAVVLAFRVLKDARLRQHYHKVRQERLTRRAEAQRSSNNAVNSSRSEPSFKPTAVRPRSNRTEPSTPRGRQPASPPKPVRKAMAEPAPRQKPKGRSYVADSSDGETYFTLDTANTSQISTDDETLEETEDDESIISRDLRRRSGNIKGGILSVIAENRFVCQCVDEVQGTVSDSCSAFDQVFNVFTLREQDINAVCGRIEKAKKIFYSQH